jgi:hypothetical protein
LSLCRSSTWEVAAPSPACNFFVGSRVSHVTLLLRLDTSSPRWKGVSPWSTLKRVFLCSNVTHTRTHAHSHEPTYTHTRAPAETHTQTQAQPPLRTNSTQRIRKRACCRPPPGSIFPVLPMTSEIFCAFGLCPRLVRLDRWNGIALAMRGHSERGARMCMRHSRRRWHEGFFPHNTSQQAVRWLFGVNAGKRGRYGFCGASTHGGQGDDGFAPLVGGCWTKNLPSQFYTTGIYAV